MLDSPPKSLLVLRFSAVGDIILTAPAVQALAQAWPETRLLFATKAQFGDLVAASPYVHQVVGLERDEGAMHFRRRVARLQPEAVLDLHGKLRSVLVRSLVPFHRRVVWKKRHWSQGLVVRLGVGVYRARMRIADRYHAAVEELVGRSLPRGELRLFLPNGAAARAREELGRRGIDLSRPLVGMAPGSMWPTKRWPAERFMALVERCVADGVQVVLTGSASETAMTSAVAAASPGVVDLAGNSLADLAAVIGECSAFVANDSGPMHMARALRVPTLAFFGSTDPAQFDFSGHALMYASEPCAPCSLYGRRTCPKGHFRCMMGIEVESAWRALCRLLEGGKAPLLTA